MMSIDQAEQGDNSSHNLARTRLERPAVQFRERTPDEMLNVVRDGLALHTLIPAVSENTRDRIENIIEIIFRYGGSFQFFTQHIDVRNKSIYLIQSERSFHFVIKIT